MNIQRVELYNLEWWDTAGTPAWKPMKVLVESTQVEVGPGKTGHIVAYNEPSAGHNPALPLKTTLLWDYLTVSDGSGDLEEGTIFGISPQIPVANLSVKIRYKVRVKDMNVVPLVFEQGITYYQIVKASFPADHITFSGTVTTGPWAPIVYVNLPGLSNAMATTPNSLFGWLQIAANWKMKWTKPDSSVEEITPSSAGAVTCAVSAAPEYGGASAQVKLTFPTLMVSTNGTHKLEISYIPNDQDGNGFTTFADSHTWSALITVLTPSLSAPLYLSPDNNVFMTVSFTQ